MTSQLSLPDASPIPLIRRCPNLVAGLAAAACLLLPMAGGMRWAQSRARAQAARFVPLLYEQKGRGEAAQIAVLQQDDLLPIYGSSELVLYAENRPRELFGTL